MKTINIENLYTNSFGDQYFQEINHTAFDNVGATATFNKVFNDVLNQENRLFIIVGSDSGLLIPYLQKYHADQGRHYIIIEKPELISHIDKTFERNEDLIDLEPEDLNFGDLPERYSDYIAHGRYTLLRSLAVIDSKNDVYRHLWDQILDKYNIFSASESGYAINNVFIDSQLNNLAANSLPVAKVENALAGKTAIIMGGGPSLDKSINWVKANQHKLVIFAAARIANRLKKEQIQPDFFVTVDPHDVSYDNSKSMLQFGDTAVLVHSNNANNKLVAEWSGIHAYLGLMYPWVDDHHPQPENLGIVGPTVTNTMTSVAAFLGAEQVLFSGVDFCYGENGQSYESESVESKTGKYLGQATNRVETYSGRIAETTPSFANARQGMEEFVAYSLKTFRSRFYTLSEDTALMKNVEYRNPNDIELPDADKDAALTQIKENLTFDLKPYKTHLKNAKRYCQEMRDLCRTVIKEAKQGKKLAKRLFKDLAETDKLTQQIVSLQKNLNDEMGPHAEFIFNYSIKAYKDFMNPSVGKDDMTRDQIKDSFVHYFSGLVDSADPLKQSIEGAITRLNHRLKETEGTKHFDKLVEQWHELHEEGRPLVWLKMNGLSLDRLDSAQREAIETLLETYQEELKATETKLSRQLKSKGESITNLLERIRRYFVENRPYDLEALVNYIAEREDEQAKDLCHLGAGFIYELRDMPDDALNEFVQIKDEKLLMEGLKRVVNITLDKKDYQTALNALEVLTHYSDEFFIAYADILAATGDGPGAAEIYVHYLNRNEEDVATWIKLVKLLIHLGLTEDAMQAIQNIKKIDPDNIVADELMNLATQPKS
ncbi:MAG: 6-hydroxymethylpterin diphosphokinase MptE-like protein [Hydrogenovibrio sp.]